MAGKKLIHGYLDRLRENLETLDEQIVNARKMSKRKGKDSNALQWAKVLRDLVELRDTTLANIKAHLLGRDETGATNEPDDVYAGNSQVEYERYFRSLLSPWTQQDLKLKCEDCGVESEEVYRRTFSHPYPQDDEHFYLCDKCLGKRTAKQTSESEEGSEASDSDSILKEFAETQGGGNAGALTGGVRNVINLVRSDDRPPAEKVKTLEEFKASVCQSAKNSRSEHVLAPGLVMLDKEIERLRAEAGKGQDAAGKPAT